MKDSLFEKIDSIQNLFIKQVDIVQKVDDFYNNAWDKLLVFGSVLFAVVGIIVPIVIQWYQKQTLKISEVSLKEDLKNTLKEELQVLIESQFQKNEARLKLLNDSANAKILTAQAKFNVERNFYKSAIGEIVDAANFSLECNDFKNIQELLELLSQKCLPNLSVEELNDLKIAGICDLNQFLDILKNKDDRTMFQTKIGEIKVQITKLPKSVKQKGDEKQKNDE